MVLNLILNKSKVKILLRNETLFTNNASLAFTTLSLGTLHVS